MNRKSPEVLTILIVDDDEGDRKHIRRALRDSGLETECTDTATVCEALQLCETRAFDCAIVDYRIPGENGLDGVSALSQRLPYMASIMSTRRGDEVVAAEAIKRGASDYIPKSHITPQSIYRSVSNAIEKAALRRKVELQRTELENFARVLAHDLKSPIQTVRGFAGVIEQNLQQGNAKNVAEYCRIIVKGVDRMGALIDALHAYVATEKPVEFGTLNMDLVVNDTLHNLEHLLQERGALVTVGELPAVRGNGPLLIQLLQNLVANGIKYCRAETPCIHIEAVPGKDAVWVFSVRDNGIGIPENHSREIFEPFNRLHATGEFEGSGLGLATCKRIVDRHGGAIWCESVAGQGTTFFFTLPEASTPSTDA